MLAAAVLAPSAKNRQPWRFIVLEGAARLKLVRLMAEDVVRHTHCVRA